jgi:streptomycin 6-kinase
MTLICALKQLQDVWNLEIEGAPSISTARMLCPVRYHGRPCVLKMVGDEQEARRAALWLEQYQERSAVHLIKHTKNALLLERITPATTLALYGEMQGDDEATHRFCDVMQQLYAPHTAPILSDKFPSMNDLAQSFDAYLSSNNQQIRRSLVKKAKQYWEEASCLSSSLTLLHGDLHHDNMVYDQRRGWLAIDPKGIMGSLEYEVSCFLRNPLSNPSLILSRSCVDRRITIIKERLALSEEALYGFAFAGSVLAAIWAVEDGQDPQLFLHYADNVKESL